ncbi:MAG: replicative DNA helicase [Oscillospiraceae bacterium]|nr:replicative DNA helicase [Oscillospiraceae bacterium]
MNFDSLRDNDATRSIEYEQTVIGAILLNPNAIADAMEIVKAEYFSEENHRKLFQIIVNKFTLGEKADAMTVLNDAVDEGVFQTSAEGKKYLLSIIEDVPTTENIKDYCEILRDKYEKRALIEAMQEIAAAAMESGEKSSALLDLAEQKIYDIRKGKETSGLVKIEDALVTAFDNLKKISGEDRDKYLGAKMGFADLDRTLTGLNKSDLIVVAARPGMGKTAFALNIVTNACMKNEGMKVAVFSLEMSNEQLVMRMLSSESRVPSQSLKTGNISGEEWERLSIGAAHLAKMNIYLSDAGGLTVPQMKAKLRRIKGLGLVVIDYLQLMDSAKVKSGNRVEVVSEITRQLKLMAKELDVPVIVLSQLARGPESRTDHRPLLSDLRESGSIEQDADIVMMLYRDAYYHPETDQQNLSECIVAKNRHGEVGTVNLVWDGQYTRFSGMAKE